MNSQTIFNIQSRKKNLIARFFNISHLLPINCCEHTDSRASHIDHYWLGISVIKDNHRMRKKLVKVAYLQLHSPTPFVLQLSGLFRFWNGIAECNRADTPTTSSDLIATAQRSIVREGKEKPRRAASVYGEKSEKRK